MKFTLSWLKRYLKTNASASEIEAKLSMIGLEVEECVDNGLIYKDFIIAEVKEASKHESSDKLQVCKVFNGKEELQIVCGAPNARAGLKVVLAPVGTKIPANGMEIKPTKIRGVESNGMLCSAEELKLGEDSEGIIELSTDAVVGNKYADYANLNDVLFDISVTPNRGDALSVYGIARDLAAAGMGELIEPKIEEIKVVGPTTTKVTIENKKECRQFSLRRIDGINNKLSCGVPSTYMRAVGSSPKTALVDISNFTMMDFGRPNHFFDADKIKGNFVIRDSKEGEKFIPISGEEMTLPEGILVVSDDSGVLAIAGVMGGEKTKITENTKNILIEMACFSEASVTKSGRTLGLLSDSRYRFERRIDFGNTKKAADFIASVVLAECGGSAYEVKIEEGEKASYVESINFDFNYIEKLSGLKISEDVAKAILTKLGFKCEGSKVAVPTFRQGDVEAKADLVEEVVRIHGLDKVESQSIGISEKELTFKNTEFLELAKRKCATLGYNESISWAFISHKLAQLFGFKDALEVLNPISSEMVVMRQSAIPSLFTAYVLNAARGVVNQSIFEVACMFDKANPHNLNRTVSGLRVGATSHKTHLKEERNFDFYDVKADVFALVSLYGLDPEKLQIKAEAPSYYHPGQSCSLYLGKTLVAVCGMIHPLVISELKDVERSAAAFEFYYDSLPQQRMKNAKAKLVLSNFQKVERDFAFVMNDNVSASELTNLIKGIDKNLIESVDIFDVYYGKNIEAGKKSVAFNVKIQPTDKTLSEEEINATSKKIVDEVTLRFSATLR